MLAFRPVINDMSWDISYWVNDYCLCSLPAEVDVKTKCNSLPVPATSAYRAAANSHLMPPVQPLLPSPSEEQPHLLVESRSHDQEPNSESTRQSLQKRIQLLQDHNLSLLNHIKMFRDVIDKVSPRQLWEV